MDNQIREEIKSERANKLIQLSEHEEYEFKKKFLGKKMNVLLEKRESLCMRSLDLIESNTSVKADECMTKVILLSDFKGKFQTEFSYR